MSMNVAPVLVIMMMMVCEDGATKNTLNNMRTTLFSCVVKASVIVATLNHNCGNSTHLQDKV